jgi:hypothetical protein
MPTDWLFYWMTLPLGLAIIGGAILLPFGFWRSILGSTYSHIGIRPYIAGYVASLIGLMLLSFTSSYLEFSGRAAAGILNESQRWTIVPGWTIYIGVLSLIFVLPLLGLIGVPVSAFLLKRRLLNFRNIALILALLWLTLTCQSWAFPSNEWHRTHRLLSFTSTLTSLIPGIALVAFPFLLGIYGTAHRYRDGT